MPRALATDSLSSAGREAMYACFRERLSAAATVKRIAELTGEKVATRTIARRQSEFVGAQAKRQERREQMEDLLAAARSGDATASEMVNALAVEQLLRDPEGALTIDPISLQRTSIQAERVRLASRKLDLQERQVKLDEEKFRLVCDREAKAIAATQALTEKARGGKSLTAEDLQKIRDIYGIN